MNRQQSVSIIFLVQALNYANPNYSVLKFSVLFLRSPNDNLHVLNAIQSNCYNAMQLNWGLLMIIVLMMRGWYACISANKHRVVKSIGKTFFSSNPQRPFELKITLNHDTQFNLLNFTSLVALRNVYGTVVNHLKVSLTTWSRYGIRIRSCSVTSSSGPTTKNISW